jgi:hypothetical protein
MKILFLTALLVTINFSLFAQVPPQAFNYSGIARDASGGAVANQNISVQISLLRGAISGSPQYVENHSVTTDAFGLFNLVIGAGAVQSGSMTSINWGADNYFLQVAYDMNGGNMYTLLGTTQLLSVPYALHAGTASSLSGGTTFSHYIGERFGGGVIFHLYRDSLGLEHGLILAPNDICNMCYWDSTAACLAGNCIYVRANSTWNGAKNTQDIIDDVGNAGTAAAICASYNGSGFNDWYLPSVQELNMVWNNMVDVNRGMEAIPGAQIMDFAVYWSSTEMQSQGAWNFSMMTGQGSYWDKVVTYKVRAVRKF